MAQTIELILDGMASSGEAIGANPHNGKRVLVADAIPGERVAVEIIDEGRNWQRARLRQVLEASPDRVDPPCPYFGPPQPVTLPDGTQLNPAGAPRCAGCLWQHIAYDRQLALKRAIVVEQLAQLDELSPDPRKRMAAAEKLVADIIALGDLHSDTDVALDYHYLTQMHFALDERGRLCLPTRRYEQSTPPLLPIDFCPLHHAQLADLFDAFAVDEETGSDLARDLSGIEMAVGATADEVGDGDEGMIVLESRSGNAPSLELGLPVNVLLRRPQGNELAAAELLVGDWSYPVALGEARFITYPSMGGAPLVSPHVTGEEAIGAIAVSVLDLQPFEHVVHLWAGAGLSAIAVAGQAATLIAVEDTELAVAALQANTAGLDNVDVHRGPARRVLDGLRRGGYETNVALLTPRDEDVDTIIFRHLNALGMLRFAVVVENATELARLIPLAREAQYELMAVQPLDLQPQQETVTIVARFDRRR